MRRLSGFDAQFIWDERPGEPQHTLKLAFLDEAASRGFDVGAARRQIADRLSRLDPLRWRVARVPFDLHHPLWIEAGAPDLDWHVRSLGVPAPGGRAELCEMVSEIASRPLDPRRPLWELWVLHGFEGTKVVLVLKLSHALADGGESRILLERLFEPAPAGPCTLPAEEAPSGWALLREAARDRVRGLGAIVRVACTSLRVARRRRARRAIDAAGEPPAPSRMRSPRTGLGGPLGPRRAFHYVSVSLTDAREVSRVFGCKVNDVLIAAVAGGVRGWLREQGRLPGLPTIGNLPASTRTEAERGSWGNRIVALPFALPTHLADPVARLRAAARAGGEVKARLATGRGSFLEDWQCALGPRFGKLLGRMARLLARLRPDLSGGVVVSNVRGPATELAAPGGAVENLVSVGHVKWMSCLNVTAWSYVDRLNLAFYACADAFPELGHVAGLVSQSFEELAKAAAREAARVRPPGVADA